MLELNVSYVEERVDFVKVPIAIPARGGAVHTITTNQTPYTWKESGDDNLRNVKTLLIVPFLNGEEKLTSRAHVR